MQSRATPEELGRRPGLPPHTRWLIAAAAAVVRPDLVFLQALANHALANGLAAAALREVGVQAIAYAGFPRALAALEALHGVLPPITETDSSTSADARPRGEQHFGVVYGRHAPALLSRLAELHPQLAALTIDVAYGRILSRPQIAGRERELMGVATLAVLDQPRQLVAHAFGARGFGAGLEEVLETIATVETCWPDVASKRYGAEVLRHWRGEGTTDRSL